MQNLRVRSHERRNDLKPAWDFISVENLTLVFNQFFTCVHMNWDGIKLKPVWISYWSFWPKWNFKPAWDLPEAKWIRAGSLDIVFNAHVHLKLMAGVIPLLSFWQKWSFILGDKMRTLPKMKCLRMSIKISGRFEMQPKWNIIWTELVFTPVWKLKPIWVHFASHFSHWSYSKFYNPTNISVSK